MDGRRTPKFLLRVRWVVGISLFLPLSALWASTSAQMETLADASHFEFLGPKSWEYQIENLPSGFKVLLKELSPEAEEKLTAFSDERVQAVQVTRQPGDYPVQVVVDLAPHLEVFDYLTDDPKRLVVDVFVSSPAAGEQQAGTLPRPPVQRAPAGELPVTVPSQQAPAPEAATPEAAAAPVEVAGLFDAADPDYQRFKVQPGPVPQNALLEAHQRIFLEFPAWTNSSGFLSQVLQEKPRYVIHEKPGQENREARFLLSLYEKGRPAGLLRSGEIFLRKYPRSDYRQIVEHMLADTYLQHWMGAQSKQAFERAMALYKDLNRKNPDSPLKERTALVTGLAYLQRGDGPSALRSLENFKSDFPDSEYLPRVKLSLAHVDLMMNSFDSALSRLRKLQGEAPSPVREEATHFLGNVYLKQKLWEQAAEAYEKARTEYPEGLKEHGFASFNLGEAYFWMQDYLQSLDAFREYAVTFPESEMSAYALTRMGEIFEILGQPSEKALTVYRESHFRFREEDGGKLSRVRLISHTMKDLSDKEISEALRELTQVADSINHPQAKEFVESVKADGYRLRGDFQKSADTLISFISQSKKINNRKKIEDGLVESLVGQMRKVAGEGNPIEALRVYGKHSDLWFKSTERLDPTFAAAQSFEKAGAVAKALELYEDLEKSLAALPADEKTRKYAVETLPTQDELWLRMAACQCALENYKACQESLKKVTSTLGPRDRVEQHLLAAKLLEKQGQDQKVLAVLKGLENSEAAGHPEVLLQLARSHASTGQHQSSAQIYEDFLKSADGVDPKKVITAYGELAQLHTRQNNLSKAQAVLEEVVDRFGGAYDLSPERYKLGKLYLETGRTAAAKEAWQPLLGQQNNFWSTLAEDQIRDLDWSEQHGRLLRSPASHR